MARKTKQEALQTRDQILDAAEELFLSLGVSRTSLQQIAQAAHVTRGAIYWHFKDKLDLLQALLDRATVPMDDIIAHTEKDMTRAPLERVRFIMNESFRQVTVDPRLRHALEIVFMRIELVGELAAMREQYLECMDSFSATIERQLQAAADAGSIGLGKASAHDIARALHAVGDGLLAQWLLAPHSFELDLVIEEAVDAYLGGLCARVQMGHGARQGASMDQNPL